MTDKFSIVLRTCDKCGEYKQVDPGHVLCRACEGYAPTYSPTPEKEEK